MKYKVKATKPVDITAIAGCGTFAREWQPSATEFVAFIAVDRADVMAFELALDQCDEVTSYDDDEVWTPTCGFDRPEMVEGGC